MPSWSQSRLASVVRTLAEAISTKRKETQPVLGWAKVKTELGVACRNSTRFHEIREIKSTSFCHIVWL